MHKDKKRSRSHCSLARFVPITHPPSPSNHHTRPPCPHTRSTLLHCPPLPPPLPPFVLPLSVVPTLHSLLSPSWCPSCLLVQILQYMTDSSLTLPQIDCRGAAHPWVVFPHHSILHPYRQVLRATFWLDLHSTWACQTLLASTRGCSLGMKVRCIYIIYVDPCHIRLLVLFLLVHHISRRLRPFVLFVFHLLVFVS